MEHAFNTNIAIQYDVNISIFIQHFKHWALLNLCNKQKNHEGLCTTRITIKELCEIFPYWTVNQIQRLLNKTESHGLIVSDNFNKNKYDQIKWYALFAKAHDEIHKDYFQIEGALA